MAHQEYPHPRFRGQRKGARVREPGVRAVGFGALRRLAVALALLASCQVPDRPPLLPGPPPEGLLESLDVEESRTLAVAPGVAYFQIQTRDEPWAIYLIRLDLDQCELGLRVLRAPKQDGMAGGRSTVSSLMEEANRDPRANDGGVGGRVLAGVNGDFFTPEGLPVGTEVVAGDIRRIGQRPVLAWRPGASPWMGMPAVKSDSVLSVGWDLSRHQADGATQVLGGFPLLLLDGGRVGDLGVADLPSFSAARHPRTAIGFDAPNNRLWIMVVDGRQTGYSEGMTLPELAAVLEQLGATDAVNLDGGGSSVMVLKDMPMSRPSDSAGERPVVNALGVVRDPGFCLASSR